MWTRGGLKTVIFTLHMRKSTYLDVEKKRMAGNRSRISQSGREFVPEALLDVEIPKIGTGTPETSENCPEIGIFNEDRNGGKSLKCKNFRRVIRHFKREEIRGSLRGGKTRGLETT